MAKLPLPYPALPHASLPPLEKLQGQGWVLLTPPYTECVFVCIYTIYIKFNILYTYATYNLFIVINILSHLSNTCFLPLLALL